MIYTYKQNMIVDSSEVSLWCTGKISSCVDKACGTTNIEHVDKTHCVHWQYKQCRKVQGVILMDNQFGFDVWPRKYLITSTLLHTDCLYVLKATQF